MANGRTRRQGDGEKGRIQGYRDLHVWQNAMDAAMAIYEMSKRFPAEEKYSMTDQVRRSSRSVAANIAEAWRKRRYKAAFIAKLNDAESEASETQTWLEFARRCNFITRDEADPLDDQYDHIMGQLVTMINQADRWTVSQQGGTS